MAWKVGGDSQKPPSLLGFILRTYLNHVYDFNWYESGDLAALKSFKQLRAGWIEIRSCEGSGSSLVRLDITPETNLAGGRNKEDK